MKQLILGVDQGIVHLGWCLLDFETGKYVVSGYVKGPNQDHTQNFDTMYNTINNILNEHTNIVAICCESLISTGRGMDTIYTNSLSGMLHTLAIQRKIAFKQFYPVTVKKAVTGTGRAKKEDVMNSIQEKFGFKKPTSHENDAIAIAYTYYKNK